LKLPIVDHVKKRPSFIVIKENAPIVTRTCNGRVGPDCAIVQSVVHVWSSQPEHHREVGARDSGADNVMAVNQDNQNENSPTPGNSDL
jgi:hypothetical protein